MKEDRMSLFWVSQKKKKMERTTRRSQLVRVENGQIIGNKETIGGSNDCVGLLCLVPCRVLHQHNC